MQRDERAVCVRRLQSSVRLTHSEARVQVGLVLAARVQKLHVRMVFMAFDERFHFLQPQQKP